MARMSESDLEQIVENSDCEVSSDELRGSTGDDGQQKDRQHVEQNHQEKLATYLDAIGVDWFHCPNERADASQAARMKKQGTKKGIPDCIILTPPPAKDTVGAVIELKRPDGYPSDVRDSQQEWLERFEGHGWSTAVCFGFESAMKQLSEWGY